jgi:hypothetical protein
MWTGLAGNAGYFFAGGVMALANLYRAAWLRLRISYHEMALRQIEPHHADVPHIVLTICELTDQLEELK